MNTNLTFHRSGTGPAGRRAGRVPSLPIPAIHPPRQPSIPDEGRRNRHSIIYHMNLKCFFGAHEWRGCTCSRCGSSRDEEHDWNGCKCRKCNASRNATHTWDGCRCPKCGATRDMMHEWQGFKCTRCGTIKKDCGHTEAQHQCSQCGMLWCESCLEQNFAFQYQPTQNLTLSLFNRAVLFGTVRAFDSNGRAFCPNCAGSTSSRETVGLTVLNSHAPRSHVSMALTPKCPVCNGAIQPEQNPCVHCGAPLDWA